MYVCMYVHFFLLNRLRKNALVFRWRLGVASVGFSDQFSWLNVVGGGYLVKDELWSLSCSDFVFPLFSWMQKPTGRFYCCITFFSSLQQMELFLGDPDNLRIIPFGAHKWDWILATEMSTNESLACHLTILSIIHSFMQSRTLILGNWFLNLRVTEGSLPTRLKSVMWLETRVWLAHFVLEWWSLELCGERCYNTLLQLDYTKLFFSRTLFSWYHLLAHDCM